MKIIIRIVTILIIIGNFSLIEAFENKPKAALDEQLGKTIPLDAKFFDEYGKEFTLGELIDKPTILNLVFYECRGICSPIISELAHNLNNVDLQLGKDYQVLTISFDPTEVPANAYSKKVNYLKILDKKPPDNAWKFLTGDSLNIYNLTDAVGFYFYKDRDQFVHPGVLIFISPDGKITRYLLGTEYLPFSIKMAILEAGEGKVGSTIAKMIKFCYAYDPEGRKYALNITRLIGIFTLILIGIFIIFLLSKPKKEIKREAQ